MNPILSIDLGGTKLAAALFAPTGQVLQRESVPLGGRTGAEVGALVADTAVRFRSLGPYSAVGVAVPGVYRSQTGTVWAPNIPGWDDYPLLAELSSAVARDAPCVIESDRTCYIMGEVWQGSARGTRNAIFVAVGTGVGAGILVDGRVLRGQHDIAGAIGWLALDRPFREVYRACGCFEYHASGPGIARAGYRTTEEVFAAYAAGDDVAREIIERAIGYWGMAVANLVSLFNPEVIVFGGGVFGPASALLDRIYNEALQWGQPISMKQVSLMPSALGNDAGLYGAARVALDKAAANAGVAAT